MLRTHRFLLPYFLCRHEVKDSERTARIIELLPQHKPKWGTSETPYAFDRAKNILFRPLKVIRRKCKLSQKRHAASKLIHFLFGAADGNAHILKISLRRACHEVNKFIVIITALR